MLFHFNQVLISFRFRFYYQGTWCIGETNALFMATLPYPPGVRQCRIVAEAPYCPLTARNLEILVMSDLGHQQTRAYGPYWFLKQTLWSKYRQLTPQKLIHFMPSVFLLPVVFANQSQSLFANTDRRIA